MHTNTSTHSPKRFPTLCRFFQQGHCRAGSDCQFRHPLPLTGTPSRSLHHAIVFGEGSLDTSPLDAFETQFKDCIQSKNLTANQSLVFVLQLPLAIVTLTVPPNAPCSIQLDTDESIPNSVKTFVNKWMHTSGLTLFFSCIVIYKTPFQPIP
ncbi:hypothetical protein DM01DRAFT_1333841 [Hesseltinella vesiculosa]|uniref:C3H1-type domain-containing protein n=1 Tax=Hesseltinella vesiculosa TaxID=101127 RepID=A0A1X2GQD5_9FUNG|nr:hypothetical protein DM01DRAFT_1333841 [Hesseltinella vesiculosa]